MSLPTTAPIDISICICTFRRPELLRQLLDALLTQERQNLQIEVVVVDNDPANSAAPTLREWQQASALPLQALHEPVPNIAVARNAAVHASRGAWILFIDDDETPDAGWIVALMRTQQRYDADAVFGPVLPRYRDDTPAWVREGDFFNRRRLATGARVTTTDARTGNVLLRKSALMQHAGPFDAAFGLSGAEDTMLFHAMLRADAVLVWCDDAAVSEEVPAQRANLSWLLRRSYRLGQTYMRSELAQRRGAARWQRAAFLGLRALMQLGVAAVVCLASLPFTRIGAAKWLRTCLAQCGKLSALAGHRYQEYGR